MLDMSPILQVHFHLDMALSVEARCMQTLADVVELFGCCGAMFSQQSSVGDVAAPFTTEATTARTKSAKSMRERNCQLLADAFDIGKTIASSMGFTNDVLNLTAAATTINSTSTTTSQTSTSAVDLVRSTQVVQEQRLRLWALLMETSSAALLDQVVAADCVSELGNHLSRQPTNYSDIDLSTYDRGQHHHTDHHSKSGFVHVLLRHRLLSVSNCAQSEAVAVLQLLAHRLFTVVNHSSTDKAEPLLGLANHFESIIVGGKVLDTLLLNVTTGDFDSASAKAISALLCLNWSRTMTMHGTSKAGEDSGNGTDIISSALNAATGGRLPSTLRQFGFPSTSTTTTPGRGRGTQESAGQHQAEDAGTAAVLPARAAARRSGRQRRLELAAVVVRGPLVVRRLDPPQPRRVRLLRQRPLAGASGLPMPRPRLVHRHGTEPMSV